MNDHVALTAIVASMLTLSDSGYVAVNALLFVTVVAMGWIFHAVRWQS